MELVSELWTLLGMRVIEISPADHDELLAAVSHLPHVIASALVNNCSMEQLKFSGTGFLDTTRIASGDVGLWHDILVSNSDKIAASMKKFIRELQKFSRSVKSRIPRR